MKNLFTNILRPMAVLCIPAMLCLSSCKQKSEPKYVALSFDDGPNLVTTPKVLDVLESFGVPASFFVEGQFITDTTVPVMKRGVSLGCEYQNHSYWHNSMPTLTNEEIYSEIAATDSLVGKAVGVRPVMFRPPYIDTDERMFEMIGHTFICGKGCEDWVPENSPEKRAQTIIDTVDDGDIILLHDFEGNQNTVEALKIIIPSFLSRGYTFVTVSELFKLKSVTPTPNNAIIYTHVGE